MPHRTNPFQQLSASILATVHAPDYLVEESVIEYSEKTGLPREIDIRITEVKNPINTTLVECRDYKRRKQDVTWIDNIDGKARSIGANRVIAISSSGFYNTAVKEAKSRGIETLHLKEAEEKEWRKWLFSISEFGLNIDFEPIVKKIHFITPKTSQVSIKGTPLKDLFFVDLNSKKKISLLDYIQGMVKDPKIINHIRATNTDNAVSHYDYTIPCDPGIGLGLPGDKFVPLLRVVFSFDSTRKSEKIKLDHIAFGGKRVLTGKPTIIGGNSRLVLEERPGQLMVMIEQRVEKLTKKTVG